jgi:hypothetical protein
MQEIGNDPSMDNGSASGCVLQAAEDSDDDNVLENWDDEDASERNSGPTFDESGDEVFSFSPLVTICICFSFRETWYASTSTQFHVITQ